VASGLKVRAWFCFEAAQDSSGRSSRASVPAAMARQVLLTLAACLFAQAAAVGVEGRSEWELRVGAAEKELFEKLVAQVGATAGPAERRRMKEFLREAPKYAEALSKASPQQVQQLLVQMLRSAVPPELSQGMQGMRAMLRGAGQEKGDLLGVPEGLMQTRIGALLADPAMREKLLGEQGMALVKAFLEYIQKKVAEEPEAQGALEEAAGLAGPYVQTMLGATLGEVVERAMALLQPGASEKVPAILEESPELARMLTVGA